MSKRKKIVLTVAVLLALLVVGSRLRKPEALPVPVVTIERGTVESTVANTRAGTIKACRRSELSVSLGGTVEKLNVKKGDRVTAGETLLQLRNDDRAAAVAQAEASVSAAIHQQKEACLRAGQDARENQRAKSLYEKRLISSTQAETANTLATTTQQACEAAKAQVKVNQANADLARTHYDLTFLRAPYDGVVVEVNSELGEYVTPSPSGVLTKPAVEILDDSCLYVTAPIDEVDARAVRVGQQARVTMDAFRGQQFSGQITRVAPYVVEVEKQARTVDVDVRLDNFPKDVPLLVGYSADIEVILNEKKNVLRVPSEAIIDKKFVYVLGKDGVLHRQEFSPGLSNWTMTEAVSGLNEGDSIVLAPDRPGVKDGVAARAETAEDRAKAAAAKKSL